MKVVDVVLGIIVIFMGLLPYLTKVDTLKKVLGFIGTPGETVFNIILIVMGAVLIIYGLRRPMPVMMRR